jgi:hypothetical protein
MSNSSNDSLEKKAEEPCSSLVGDFPQLPLGESNPKKDEPLSISITNIVYDIPQFQIQNVFLLENKKNMIMDGNFTKIIYSDDLFILYGIFLNVPLLVDGFSTNGVSGNKYFFKFQPNHLANENTVNNMINIEYRILEFYKSIFKVNKKITTVLRNQLYNGYIKIYKNMSHVREERVSLMSEDALKSKHANKGSGNGGAQRAEILDNVYPAKKSFLIKISGVWEDNESIGLTYKFELLSGKRINLL